MPAICLCNGIGSLLINTPGNLTLSSGFGHLGLMRRLPDCTPGANILTPGIPDRWHTVTAGVIHWRLLSDIHIPVSAIYIVTEALISNLPQWHTTELAEVSLLSWLSVVSVRSTEPHAVRQAHQRPRLCRRCALSFCFAVVAIHHSHLPSRSASTNSRRRSMS